MAEALPMRAKLLRALARAALVVERVWRGVWPAQAFIAGYLALASLGVLADIGWASRLLVLAAALAGAAWGVRNLWRDFRWPARREAERRLEEDGDLKHRPFEVLSDRPAHDDARSVAAWRLHSARMRAAIGRARLGALRASLAPRDPFAARHAVLLLLIGGVFVGWGEFGERVARAMQVWPVEAARPSAVEMWIDPPAYTAAAPIRPTAALAVVQVPAGSLLKAVAEASGGAPRLIAGSADVAFQPTEIEGEYAIEQPLTESGRLALVDADLTVLAEWPLEIIPDAPPEATLAGPPAVSEAGVLRFDYAVTDDYGVVSADMALAPADGVPAGGYSEQEALPVPLPQNAKSAKGAMFRDLTPHRWAGRLVEARMRASDAIGQTGESEAVRFQAPEREFLHPVGQALIRARKQLDANPRGREPIAATVGALMRAPADYGYSLSVATALGVIRARLVIDDEEPSYTLARDLMWETALRLEDGDLSAAERALRMARERLAEAMARDASPEEIAKLVEELKEALQRFMEAMARAQDDDDLDGQQADPNMQMMQSRDLMQMLDQIRELTEQGARDAARQALSEVDRMLEQLSQARMMRQDMQQLRQMMQGLRETQSLIQRQQRLMDETFQRQRGQQGEQGQQGRQGQQGQQGRQGQQGQQGQGQQGQGQQGQQGQMGQNGQGQQGAGGLAGQQEALRRALGEVMRLMGENGQIPGGLGQAERSMRGAVDGLRQGNMPGALGDQGDALEQLRQAAQGMAEQLARQMGGGNQGREFVNGQNGEQPGGEDPLGRALRGRATGNVDLPDASDLQRARAIRDEVSRRAGERSRPAIELDYLQRLLERF